jgi:hypothetical protein
VITQRGIRQKQTRREAAGRLLCILLFLAVAFTAAPRWCQAETTVSSSLNPAQFSVDMGAVLTITIIGSRSADVHMPTIAGLSFQGRGRNTQMQFLNGSFSSSLSFTYLVQAEKPGKYTIPPVSVSVDGSTLTTKPITFEVTQAGSAPSTQGTAPPAPTRLRAGETDKIAFLRLSELKDTSWTGEVIPLQIKAYFRQGIKAGLNALPILKGDGFVMPQLDQKPPQTEETVDGIAYSVLTWSSSLSAVKEGRHALTVELEATLLLPHRRNPFPGLGDQDLFQDDFFQNFFGGFESKTVKVASRPITIEARQLPADNQPPDFSGAVGQFNLSVQAKPTKVEAGDPITLTMAVSGKGNFDRVEPPKFPEDQKWKAYSPAAEFKPGDNPTEGKKIFEQAIVVKDDRVTEIPPVSFVFFNPETEKYVTLTSTPIPLSMKHRSQGAAAAAKSDPASPPVPAAAKDEPENHGIAGLAPIHLHMGSLQKKIIPLFAKGWFTILLALCTILLLSAFVWKARLRYLRNNPELIRKKEMQKLLAKNMARIGEAEGKNDSGQYLAACRKALQELLGRHWQIEPTAITLADLHARLDPSSSLIVIFAAAEQGAYATCSLSAAQMHQYSDQVHRELSKLL